VCAVYVGGRQLGGSRIVLAKRARPVSTRTEPNICTVLSMLQVNATMTRDIEESLPMFSCLSSHAQTSHALPTEKGVRQRRRQVVRQA